MERIKQQVDQLQQQLAGLTLSQKMLTATLVAIMVATVVWWARYAATDEMIVLLEQSLTAEDVGAMGDLLGARGIGHEVRGDRIMVSAADREAALGMLAFHRRMPADTTNHIAKAIGQIGSFDSRQKIDMAHIDAQRSEMARVLRSMPHVRSAEVMLDPKSQRRLGSRVEPSAAVTLFTDGRGDAKQLAQGAAAWVSGSVAELSADNVNVIVDGVPVNGAEPEDNVLAGGDRMLAVRREAESYFSDKVRVGLSYIPGLVVSVSVDINDTVSRESKTTIDPDSKLVAPVREVTESQETEGADSTGWDAGFGANMGSSLEVASGVGGSRETRESGEVENRIDYGKTAQETFRPAGQPTLVSCSLAVPMSWFVQQWQNLNDTDERPAPADINAYKQGVTIELQQQVAGLLGNLAPERIHVFVHNDAGIGGGGLVGAGAALAGVGASGEATAGISALIRDYGKEVAMAALAAVSLFLVSTMMKKSVVLAPAPTIFEPHAMFGGGEELAGIAGEGGNLLMAQEIDEEAVHAGQVLEQVQTLVKENPDAAAALVRRWLSAG